MILLVDNKDSFVWNLAEYASFFDDVLVKQNTATLADVRKIDPDGIIISPGPGSPDRKECVGNSPEIVLEAGVPLLGVCLGHQVIGHVFGATVAKVPPVHGKASSIFHDNNSLYLNVKNPLMAGRYHSLALMDKPNGFEITATTKDGTIMGIRCKKMQLEGVQFHPESILTKNGSNDGGVRIIRNFVDLTKGKL
ncbi:MAG: aminodeoxychorismate/anthranilate synthase component II [Candidatus Methanofastidiosia archaeon]